MDFHSVMPVPPHKMEIISSILTVLTTDCIINRNTGRDLDFVAGINGFISDLN
jgi:hypothetical protein